jgi:hypothetical protein
VHHALPQRSRWALLGGFVFVEVVKVIITWACSAQLSACAWLCALHLE